MAAIKGSVGVIPLLVQKGADINSKDNVSGGWPLVTHISMLHSISLCSLFQTGRTPLHAACSEGHKEVVITLIELGANQAALDKVRSTR